MSLNKNKTGERNKAIKNLLNNLFAKRKAVVTCSIFLVAVICVSAFIIAQKGDVVYAAGPIFWGHEGSDGVEKIGIGELARFGDAAEYSDDSWGDFVLGGINRVDKAHLPTNRPDPLNSSGDKYFSGVSVLDTYEKYITSNVSVVRHSGKTDSNLGISVNSEAIGYIDMTVNSSAVGRYLYYSVSVESLWGDHGENYGTFAVDIESEKGLVTRTEKNNCGGFAFATTSGNYKTYSDSENWVSGYEYGCIDLGTFANNSKAKIKSVYLFGTSKTKTILNYLIISDVAPDKIDVANGNIISVGVDGKNDSPNGVTRTYSNKNGIQGTATLTLSDAPAFAFENLVVDTDKTPYLYYSVTADALNKATLYFLKGNSEYYIAKKDSEDSKRLTTVTGCIKVKSLLGEGVVNFRTSDIRSKGFVFGAGGNLKINYLFFRSGVEVVTGQNVIVKNVDAINIYDANGNYKNYSVESLANGSTTHPGTYSDGGNVYAEYKLEIDSRFPVEFCWYVNTTDRTESAKRIGTKNSSHSNLETILERDDLNATIKTSVSKSTEGDKIVTTLRVLNPNKKLTGLYFFCLAVVKNNSKSYVFENVITQDFSQASDDYWVPTIGFCRMDVANNIVYYQVNQDGTNDKIAFEDWLVYGTEQKIVEAFDEHGCVQYNKFTNEPSFEKGNEDEGYKKICKKYTIPDYSYNKVEEGVDIVKFNGWMLFEQTVKNRNGAQSYNAYVTEYKKQIKKLGEETVVYTDAEDHDYWTFPAGLSFTLDGDIGSVYCDTTLNFYSRWKIPVDAQYLEIKVFVDEFGTTFMADENGQIIHAPKGDDSENKFLLDVLYVGVAPKTDGSSATVSGGGAKLQYLVEGGEWISIDDAASKLAEIYTEESNIASVESWYNKNTSYSYEIVYAVKFDTKKLLEKFEKANENEAIKLKDKFSIEFRCIAGISSNGGWFNFMGEALCGKVTFVPFKYHQLT